jgi:predicted metal-dependent phosphoesterase TrpH
MIKSDGADQDHDIVCSKADLHIHSIHSKKCGLSSIKSIMDYVEKMTDLDVIAITDHDEICGALKAQGLAHTYSFEVIIGEEIYTREGEIIGLFLKKKIDPRKSLPQTLYEIHKQGGLAIVPHPFYFYGKFPGFKRAISISTLNKIIKQEKEGISIDALEAFNPSWAGYFSKRKAYKFNTKVFNLPITAGSDAHDLGQIGRVYTIFPGKSATDLKKSILDGHTLIQTNYFWSAKELASLVGRNIKKRIRKYGQKITFRKK